ncbi:MAG: hypothetical protein WC530_07020 [Candidatus Omnitrophota bacterium]|jgi:hypothetical protein
MRPLFTVHAGEYLTACYIEARFKNLRVWIPSRDDGVDLLVTNKRRSKSLALQVKFSKDFLPTNASPSVQSCLKAFGWWTLNAGKIKSSAADYWVFVLPSFKKNENSYIIIRPSELLGKCRKLHGPGRLIQFYLWVTAHGACWEARDLAAADKAKVAEGSFRCPDRDFSPCLNNWKPLKQLSS